jgi:riboflavin kinase/FMN adenylyltransferase
MNVVRGAARFAATAAERPAAARLALAIGNFDGVHLGHAALLAETRARAARRGGPSAVLTFTPHPARLFAPDRAPPLIMPLDRRLQLIAEHGIDVAIVEPFTRAFASIEAPAFVSDVLARDLGARDVIVGYDFSFGRGRTGNAARLSELGAAAAIDVAVIPPVAIDGLACSSTRVRELVAAGDTAAAARLLGRPFELEGAVTRGAGRGRGLGFPTANVVAEAELRPKLGIYAARARVMDGPLAGTTRPAALSVGTNPQFTDSEPPEGSEPPATASGRQSPPSPARSAGGVTIEAYLLDFEGDLYDRRLRLEVGERLRDERRFESIDALIAQIREDVARVRGISS